MERNADRGWGGGGKSCGGGHARVGSNAERASARGQQKQWQKDTARVTVVAGSGACKEVSVNGQVGYNLCDDGLGFRV